MRRYSLIILSGVLCFIFIPLSWADSLPVEVVYPVDKRLEIINQELDKIEASREPHRILSATSAVVPKQNEFEFSSESYWAKFDEPKNFSQKGFLSGYNLKYAHRISTDPKSMLNMFGVQAQWASGKFRQPAGVGPSGIKDNTYDLRGIVGKDFYPSTTIRTKGYFGFGYRYLKDNSEGLNTVVDGFTLLGYQRYSHYEYLPLGVDIVYQANPAFSLESNMEYDYVVHGWQVSKIGVLPGFDTLVVQQGGGNGLRASLRLNLYFKYLTAFAEWFYRYWDIPASNSRIQNGYSFDEPRNNTQEFGFQLGLQI